MAVVGPTVGKAVGPIVGQPASGPSGPVVRTMPSWGASGEAINWDYASGITVPAPSGITAGQLLTIAIGGHNNGGSNIFTTTPSGWTQLYSIRRPGSHQTFFYKIATGSEGNVTVASAATFRGAAFYCRYTDVDNDAPINGHATNTGVATTLTVSGPTTTLDNCLAIGLLAMDIGTSTWSFDPSTLSWTKKDQHYNQFGSGHHTMAYGHAEKAVAGSIGNTVFRAQTEQTAAVVAVLGAPS